MRTGTATPPTGGNFTPTPFVQPDPPKARRQPAVLALGVALMGASAVGFVFWNHQAAAKSSVLMLAKDVPYGTKITADDLTTVQVALNTTGVRYVASDQEPTVLTMSATTQLHAGALLNPADVSTAPPTPPGTSLVVVDLKDILMPSGIAPGKKLVLVANGVIGDANGKYTVVPDSAGAHVLSGSKTATFKVTVVSLTQSAAGAPGKVTFAVDPAEAANIELFADEQRLGVIVPPSGQ
ncbi:SAF domain-containing protein [Catenulispora subtropica]|uniref:SAF domain-containing protein n=1 Tax=Catenulispora subtropica TaxID=450798 RepID=A0ABN2RUT9_9ACTN